MNHDELRLKTDRKLSAGYILKRNIELYIANHNMDMAIVTVKHHDKIDTMNYENTARVINDDIFDLINLLG